MRSLVNNSEVKKLAIPRPSKWIHLLRVAVFLVVGFTVAGCQRYLLNNKMEELCAQDGGLRVYETVFLSPEEYSAIFSQTPSVGHIAETYGPAYKYTLRIDAIAGRGDELSGGVVLKRVYESIERRSDGKKLGENVGYFRRGGIPLAPEPESITCPEKPRDLARSVFLRKE